MPFTTQPLDASTWDAFAGSPEGLPSTKHKREYDKDASAATGMLKVWRHAIRSQLEIGPSPRTSTIQPTILVSGNIRQGDASCRDAVASACQLLSSLIASMRARPAVLRRVTRGNGS
jgi:hypothetical protein